jgi:hypothetical protein
MSFGGSPLKLRWITLERFRFIFEPENQKDPTLQPCVVILKNWRLTQEL